MPSGQRRKTSTGATKTLSRGEPEPAQVVSGGPEPERTVTGEPSAGKPERPARAPRQARGPRQRPRARRGQPPTVDGLLAAAVADLGGSTRDGQVAMAEAVRRAIETGEHLAVQAGTGTGKSLAYLIPAVAYASATGACVVVATATIALQRQLIDRDLPRLAAAVKPLLGREPTFAILKGRRNYLCLHRLNSGAPEDPGDTLFDPTSASAVGQQVRRLNEWAADTETGDRDELVPGVEERAWRQVSVSARECLGAPRCPYGTDCFAERAREVAGQVDVVVTNHALLAIDSLEEFPVLPEHAVVVIDEAHDLVNRVTSAAAAELSEPIADAAYRRCSRVKPGEKADRLKDAADAFGRVIPGVPAGRMDFLSEPLAVSLAALRDAAAACAAEVNTDSKDAAEDADRLSQARAALSLLDDVRATAERVLTAFQADIAMRPDVVWMDVPFDESRRPPTLRVAPLDVGGLLAERLFGRRTVVLTSATLSLGGSFEPLARQWGLPPPRAAAATPPGQGDPAGPGEPAGAAKRAATTAAAPPPKDAAARETPEKTGPTGEAGPAGETANGARPDAEGRADAGRSAEPGHLAWLGLDVGSPFDHPRSGILYVAKHLPPPGRDGLPAAYLAELAELIGAAGGRTLGLFSSMRAARQAAEELRGVISQPLLCQGEDSTAQLVREFAEDEATCLFGTLSLWQGVDVPGSSLQLVVIDRIPFPRPDDPLASARQRAVAARGGNGFMAVAASHAALLLAQGAERLLRRTDDRNMVAILDPRLVTARYGSFLRASLPRFWGTTDPAVARAALRRLSARSG
ncbi:MAG TPA: ATP-dependent DNA helicase [Streptosporangiaceae bacterium]